MTKKKYNLIWIDWFDLIPTHETNQSESEVKQTNFVSHGGIDRVKNK